MYLPPTSTPLLTCDRDRSPAASGMVSNRSPAASGTVSFGIHQQPTVEPGFDTLPVHEQRSRGSQYCADFTDDQLGFTDILRGADRLIADRRQPVVVPPLRLGAVGSPMEGEVGSPVAESLPQKAKAGDSDSTVYASSGTDRSRSSGASRQGRVRRRLRANG